MKTLRRALLTLVLAAPLLPAQMATPGSLHGGLIGHWTGTLEYKDYRQPDKRVTLPTIVDIAASDAGGVSLHFTYDDGPGKTVRGEDHFEMGANGETVEWTGVTETPSAIFRVVSFTASDATMRLVLERQGRDNDMPATLRETLTIDAASFTVLKEVQPPGQDFTFRHAYRLRRTEDRSR